MAQPQEIWAVIADYPAYQVSNLGRVQSFKQKTPRILLQDKSKDGYYQVKLSNQDGRCNKWVHRLVGTTFLPNPNNLPQIDHIDRNKTNNTVDNLRWVSIQENNINKGKINVAKASSIYKGVSKSGGKWTASHSLKGKNTYLGTFDDEKEAAEAYDNFVISNGYSNPTNRQLGLL